MTTTAQPMVILVNEQDKELDVCEKGKAHEQGYLHRAFSIFIFNDDGKLLLQQRAESKYHTGGLWTNTCCSHPQPGEETIIAAGRRLLEEMGFETTLTKVFDFIYKVSFDNGLIEHEFDHVFTGIHNGPVRPDPAEVKDVRFLHLYKVKKMMAESPGQFTPWFMEAFPGIENWWNTYFKDIVA